MTTKTYTGKAQLIFQVEADSKAEADRIIAQLIRDTAKELPTGVSFLKVDGKPLRLA